MPTIARDVKQIKFDGFQLSADGETIILTIVDPAGNQAFLGLDWHDAPGSLALIQQGAEAAKQVRAKLGKIDTLSETQTTTFFLVSGYEVGEHSNGALKILALHASNGLRFDFALSADMPDPRGTGKTLPQAIGELLIGEDKPRRPRVQ